MGKRGNPHGKKGRKVGGPIPKTPEDLEREKLLKVRRDQAADLRIKGHSYSEIATQLNVSISTVVKDIKLALDTPSDSIEQARKILIARRERELRRLDGAIAHITKALQKADGDKAKGTESDEHLRLQCIKSLAIVSAARGSHLEALRKLQVPDRLQIGGSVQHNHLRIDFSTLSNDELISICGGQSLPPGFSDGSPGARTALPGKDGTSNGSDSILDAEVEETDTPLGTDEPVREGTNGTHQGGRKRRKAARKD